MRENKCQRVATSKRFKEATRFQEMIEKLQYLSKYRPSIKEVMNQAAKISFEIDEASTLKGFQNSDELHDAISSLQEEIQVRKGEKNLKTQTVTKHQQLLAKV